MEDAEIGKPSARIMPDDGKRNLEEQLAYVSDNPLDCIQI